MGSIDDIHRRSIEDPEGFWGEAAQVIDWSRPCDRVLDAQAQPAARWFVGGRLNTCHNALDRHVDAGHGERLALIHDSAYTGDVQRISYRELRDRVARFAGALCNEGVVAGDRVLIYIPMIPEAVVAMLACARIGAVHSVVFGGFASAELASRIDDADPKVVVMASCGLEPGRVVEYMPLVQGAIELSSHKPSRCIVVQRPQAEAPLREGRDISWADAVAAAQPADCVDVEATDPLYILYTSGTTGKPKGVLRDNGGHAVALAWSMKHIYGVRPGEVFWAASDVGWVVGHSYIVYGPLLHGCTTVMYEGKPVGTPDAGAFWRVIADHGVSTMFTAPTALRAIRQRDPQAQHLAEHDLSSFRALFLAGEHCDADTLGWATEVLKVPVIDHFWQTESGWPMIANCLGIEALPVKPGSPTHAVPGWDFHVLDAQGRELQAGQSGMLVVKLPLPPGSFPTLWRNEERFRQTYISMYPGYYQTDDAGHIDEDGYIYVMGRTDDIINVAGHRLSTGVMEGVLGAHPDVAECAVVGAADALKGQVPLGLVVLKAGADREPAQLVAELVAAVREQIGPVAAFKHAAVVERLPKTRSGKVLRATIRKLADGKHPKAPATIDDPAILDEIAGVLKTLGYAGA